MKFGQIYIDKQFPNIRVKVIKKYKKIGQSMVGYMIVGGNSILFGCKFQTSLPSFNHLFQKED